MLQRISRQYNVLTLQYEKLKKASTKLSPVSENLEPYLKTFTYLKNMNVSFIDNFIQLLNQEQKGKIIDHYKFMTQDLLLKIQQIHNFYKGKISNKQNQGNKSFCFICNQNIHENNIRHAKNTLQHNPKKQFFQVVDQFKKLSDEKIFTEDQNLQFQRKLYQNLSQKQKVLNMYSRQIQQFTSLVDSSIAQLSALKDIEEKQTEKNNSQIRYMNMGKIGEDVTKYLKVSFQNKIPPWIQKMFNKMIQIYLASIKSRQKEHGTQTFNYQTTDIKQLQRENRSLKKMLSDLRQQFKEFLAYAQKLKQLVKQKSLAEFNAIRVPKSKTTNSMILMNPRKDDSPKVQSPEINSFSDRTDRETDSDEDQITKYLESKHSNSYQFKKKKKKHKVILRKQQKNGYNGQNGQNSDQANINNPAKKKNSKSHINLNNSQRSSIDEENLKNSYRQSIKQMDAKYQDDQPQQQGKISNINTRNTLKKRKRLSKQQESQLIIAQLRKKIKNGSSNKNLESNQERKTSNRRQDSFSNFSNNSRSSSSIIQNMKKISKNQLIQEQIKKREKKLNTTALDKKQLISIHESLTKEKMRVKEVSDLMEKQAQKKGLFPKINERRQRNSQGEYFSAEGDNQNGNNIQDYKQKLKNIHKDQNLKQTLQTQVQRQTIGDVKNGQSNLNQERVQNVYSEYLKPVSKGTQEKTTINEEKVYLVLKQNSLIPGKLTFFEFKSLLRENNFKDSFIEDNRFSSLCSDRSDKSGEKVTQQFKDQDYKLFFSPKMAYKYEDSLAKNYHKRNIAKLTLQENEECIKLFEQISCLKKLDKRKYDKICSLLRYPYQTLYNNFAILNFVSDLNYATFELYYRKILWIHRKCQNKKVLCPHVLQFFKINLME